MEKEHLDFEEAKNFINLYKERFSDDPSETFKTINQVAQHLTTCNCCKKLINELYNLKSKVKKIYSSNKQTQIGEVDFIQEFINTMQRAHVEFSIIQQETGIQKKFAFDHINDKAQFVFKDSKGSIMELPMGACNIDSFYKYALGKSDFGELLKDTKPGKMPVKSNKYKGFSFGFDRVNGKKREQDLR